METTETTAIGRVYATHEDANGLWAIRETGTHREIAVVYDYWTDAEQVAHNIVNCWNSLL